MAPNLALNYSSGTADGVLGDVQAPWTGMGWNVDSVEVARKITNGPCEPCGSGSYGYENEFILLFNGNGHELITEPPATLSDGLVSYWDLEEASGTRVDSHGSNDLTDNNTVTQTDGKVDNAGQFTLANSEKLSHADNASLSTGDVDWTVARWAYADSLSGETMISGKAGANDREWILRYYDVTDRFQFFLANTDLLSANNLGSPTTNTWYFIVLWHDAANDKIYLQVNNGAADSMSTTVAGLDSTADFTIGYAEGNSSYWDGRVDEVGFWKRVLTTEERTALYNVGGGASYPFTGATPGRYYTKDESFLYIQQHNERPTRQRFQLRQHGWRVVGSRGP